MAFIAWLVVRDLTACRTVLDMAAIVQTAGTLVWRGPNSAWLEHESEHEHGETIHPANRRRESVTISVALKIFGIAFAVGLDVLALSIAVGIMQIPFGSRLRLGVAFSVSEVVMQAAGYAIGTGAGHIVGAISTYAGFAVLAGVGAYIIYGSSHNDDSFFKVDSVWGFIALCASISLDSLGIGVSLPGVPLPLIPLLSTVAVSTLIFTGIGLAFGSQLGSRYKRLAERAAGSVLVILAVFFTVQHIVGWAPN